MAHTLPSNIRIFFTKAIGRGEVPGVVRTADKLAEVKNVEKCLEFVADEYKRVHNMDLHPAVKLAIRKRISDTSNVIRAGTGLPGMHAEIIAVNEIYVKLSAANIKTTAKVRSAIQNATYKLSGDSAGKQFVACHNCSSILKTLGTRVLTGVKHLD